MEVNGFLAGVIADPRGMIGRIYVQLHKTLLHTECPSNGTCGFREDFKSISHYKPMADNHIPEAWHERTTWALLAGFIKRISIHIYTLNILKTIKTQLIYRFFPPFRDTQKALFIAKSARPSSENLSTKTERNLAFAVDFLMKMTKSYAVEYSNNKTL